MIKTITVKQQQELHRLMKDLREKTDKFITINFQSYYHEVNPKQEFVFYMEQKGHVYFDTIEELIDHVGMKVRKEEYAHRD